MAGGKSLLQCKERLRNLLWWHCLGTEVKVTCGVWTRASSSPSLHCSLPVFKMAKCQGSKVNETFTIKLQCVCVQLYKFFFFSLFSSQIFHFYLVAYPLQEGHLKGRVQWYGNPARGDASIQLLNASLSDNGTYSCAVRNPPDFQGSPSNTILTVSLKSKKCFERCFITILLNKFQKSFLLLGCLGCTPVVLLVYTQVVKCLELYYLFGWCSG